MYRQKSERARTAVAIMTARLSGSVQSIAEERQNESFARETALLTVTFDELLIGGFACTYSQ
jgi:hypothetical protein